MFIDATVIKGSDRTFTVSITQDQGGGKEIPVDLSTFKILFKVLGSPTADAKVLVLHEITSNSDVRKDGLITDSANGQFSFTITKEDTNLLGLGDHPIMMELIDLIDGSIAAILGEGGTRGEFNKINIVQV